MGMEQCRAVVPTVMNPYFPQYPRIYLTRYRTVTCTCLQWTVLIFDKYHRDLLPKKYILVVAIHQL
jgi:hypothetical protein